MCRAWPEKATRDEPQIRKWWAKASYNIGISTEHYGDDKALLVVDVDNKSDKKGGDALLALELNGYEFPTTFEQSTPTGGKHLIYVTDAAVKQGVNVLGNGLDIRSRGGYIVGSGSVTENGSYARINGHIALTPAPQWLVHRAGSGKETHSQRKQDARGRRSIPRGSARRRISCDRARQR